MFEAARVVRVGVDMHGDILPNSLQAFATDPQHFSLQLPNEAGAAGDRTGSTQLNQSQSARGRHLRRVAAYLADERRSTCRTIKANRKPKRPLRRT
jgi:hypothetical protein